MDKFLLAAIAGTATLLASAGAFADEPGKGRIAAADSFTSLDRNGDHRISRSEAGFDRLLSQTFADVDADGDGFVSAAEFAAAEKSHTSLTAR